MNRSVKIVLALCFLILGCVLTENAQSMLVSDMEWLAPVYSVAGFIVVMVAGLYCVLKVVKPLIY
jgi:hypothetical protein